MLTRGCFLSAGGLVHEPRMAAAATGDGRPDHPDRLECAAFSVSRTAVNKAPWSALSCAPALQNSSAARDFSRRMLPGVPICSARCHLLFAMLARSKERAGGCADGCGVAVLTSPHVLISIYICTITA